MCKNTHVRADGRRRRRPRTDRRTDAAPKKNTRAGRRRTQAVGGGGFRERSRKNSSLQSLQNLPNACITMAGPRTPSSRSRLGSIIKRASFSSPSVSPFCVCFKSSRRLFGCDLATAAAKFSNEYIHENEEPVFGMILFLPRGFLLPPGEGTKGRKPRAASLLFNRGQTHINCK